MSHADDPIPWGTDGPISLPVPKENLTGLEVPAGDGFVFTQQGLRLDITEADRDNLLAQAYKPGVIPRG